MKHYVSAAGLVLNDRDEVLMIKAPNPLRGWEYPGGVVEEGEMILDALKREIREESGVEVEVLRLVGVCQNVQKCTVNFDFVCRYISGVPTTSDESLEVGWFTKEEALKMAGNPMTKKRLEHMLAEDGTMNFFGFIKFPFEIIEEVHLDSGIPKEK